jgi:hypothetical protein
VIVFFSVVFHVSRQRIVLQALTLNSFPGFGLKILFAASDLHGAGKIFNPFQK